MEEEAYARTLATSRTLVADDRVTPAPADEEAPMQRGDLLGRYVVVERLGAGGMGVVYVAFDPELDRKVALKILGRSSDPGGSVGAARLLREAKALARLSHPNVVAVHDAGIAEGRVFVAMEFVPGVTLRQYLGRQPLPWRRVLELFLAAGRGLHAAHAAGLIHRDFKPDNVLVGDDGRVRVLDFGLARSSEADHEDPQAPPPLPDAQADLGSLASLDSRLTQAGALVGTPAYMAPEQYLARPLDARSDQFSFCIALWEAIYGVHPFGEGGALGLLQAITRGELRQTPKDRRTPQWLPRALARGLSMSPARRWPDMSALLTELERRARSSRRRRLGGLALLGSGMLLGAGLFGYALSDSEPDPCAAAADTLAGAWDPERRAAVAAALSAAERPYARATAERVVAALDARAAAWADMATDACRATHVRREQSPELLDLRTACLQERRAELAALSDLLARAGPEVVDRAVQAVAALTPLERCADAIALTTAVPPPDDPAILAQLAEIRPRLAEAKALLDAGRLAEGLKLAVDAELAAERSAYRPILAEALYTLGLLQNRSGDPKQAEVSLTRAALAATAAKLDDLAARAMIELIGCVGVYQARFPEAERWSDLAGAMLERIDPRGRTLEAKRLSHAGIIADMRGDLPAARALHERALALLDRPDPPDLPALVGALSNLGNVLAGLGLHADAVRLHRRAVELAEALYGPEHPQLATLSTNLGAALADIGHDDEAAALQTRALAIKERALGPDHLSVAASLTNVAQIHLRQGKLAEAEPMLRRALAIKERTLGAEHPDLAEPLCFLADLARQQGRVDEAIELDRRALAIVERPGVDPGLAMPALAGLGAALLVRGDARAALDPLRRALALEADAHAKPDLSARVRLSLADALWSAPDGRREARALVERARDMLVGTGESFADDRDRVARWLADHPPGA